MTMQWWSQFLEILGKLGILIGGTIGIYLAWLRVTAANRQAEAQIRQAEVQRRNYVTELFSSAVGQLRDESWKCVCSQYTICAKSLSIIQTTPALSSSF